MTSFQPTLSPDGYIRMSADQLLALPLQHGFTTIASEVRELRAEDAESNAIYGTSEWVSNIQALNPQVSNHQTSDQQSTSGQTHAGYPQVSLSWDWKVSIDQHGETRFTVLGEPYSNVRIVDNNGQDQSIQDSLQQLRHYIEQLAWQTITMDQIKGHL